MWYEVQGRCDGAADQLTRGLQPPFGGLAVPATVQREFESVPATLDAAAEARGRHEPGRCGGRLIRRRLAGLRSGGTKKLMEPRRSAASGGGGGGGCGSRSSSGSRAVSQGEDEGEVKVYGGEKENRKEDAGREASPEDEEGKEEEEEEKVNQQTPCFYLFNKNESLIDIIYT